MTGRHVLVDVTGLDIGYRGYPLTAISAPAIAERPELISATVLMSVLAALVDVAEPDEPAGWLFTTTYLGRRLFLERCGGTRDLATSRHEQAGWVLYLEEDR